MGSQEDMETSLPPGGVATQADDTMCDGTIITEEESLQNEPNNDDGTNDKEVTYSIIENSSQRGKPKLLDNQGFSYTLRARKSNVTYWRCAVRNRKVTCGASVVQRGDDFTRGPIRHSHQSNPNNVSVARMLVSIKSKASEDFSKSASSVVREVYQETFGDNISTTLPGIPKEVNLARRANRIRQRMKSGDPVDLAFALCEGFDPEGTNLNYSDPIDPNSAPSMVFRYRHTKVKKRKKGHKHVSKRKDKAGKNKGKKTDSLSSSLTPDRDGQSSHASGNTIVVVEDTPASQYQSSESTVLSDVAKTACLKEIASLIAERDAALKRVEEIEQLLFSKYQIPVVDCR